MILHSLAVTHSANDIARGLNIYYNIVDTDITYDYNEVRLQTITSVTEILQYILKQTYIGAIDDLIIN